MSRKRNKDNQKTTGGLVNEENVSEANSEDDSRPTASPAQAGNTDSTENMQNPSTTDIMKAIPSFKQDFHIEMDGVLAAIRNVQSDIKECSGRISEAEQRISTAEDTINNLQATVDKLEKKAKLLANKVDDLECRSRRNNVRILGIPEKEEGSDPCSYMEKWIADNLDIPPPVLERAHRLPSQNRGLMSRAFIVKCLNYKDREGILRAVRMKKEVTYKNNRIRFLPDLSAEVYKQQRQYDDVRKRLRDMGILKHRIIFPARLMLTHGECTTIFDRPVDVDKYIKELGEPEAN